MNTFATAIETIEITLAWEKHLLTMSTEIQGNMIGRVLLIKDRNLTMDTTTTERVQIIPKMKSRRHLRLNTILFYIPKQIPLFVFHLKSNKDWKRSLHWRRCWETRRPCWPTKECMEMCPKPSWRNQSDNISLVHPSKKIGLTLENQCEMIITIIWVY